MKLSSRVRAGVRRRKYFTVLKESSQLTVPADHSEKYLIKPLLLANVRGKHHQEVVRGCR
jgi:hypothetical protein